MNAVALYIAKMENCKSASEQCQVHFVFFKKMGQSRPLLFIFVLFLLQYHYKLKKA